MYHSITFGDKNTWDDWHLIPSSRPVINPPSKKKNIVDIPGADGSLDLSDVVSGGPVFENRSGSIEFIAENGFRSWNELYSEIMNYLHGKKTKMILEDDPDYYYDGAFDVSNWNSGSQYSTITIEYDVKPYKYRIDGSGKSL